MSEDGSGPGGGHRAFAASAASVAAARRFVRERLGPVDGATSDAVVLLLSELATNAVCHGGGGFEVRVVRSATSVTVEVDDPGSGLPLRRDPAPFDSDGRGLRIVEELATDWGVRQHERGKVVWFRLEW